MGKTNSQNPSSADAKQGLSTFGGVFTPSILTISGGYHVPEIWVGSGQCGADFYFWS